MMKKSQTPSVNQTAIGNENIQVVGSHNVITRITNFFAGDTEQQRARRNRRAMLELVKNTWIKGVLERSLYNEVLIELGIEELPGAIDYRWDMQIQIPDKSIRRLPPGASMIQVFHEMNGAMLILGSPGAGKTTMLLELARDTITRAEQDSAEPIPVVFHLSSWSGEQFSFANWLIEELKEKYLIPEKIARPWLEDDDLLVLLDGLDEVPFVQRDNCVKAINDFRQRYLVQLAICSRISDYEALTSQLKLNGAIVIQELTSQQIDQYFEEIGINQSAVLETLGNDAYREFTRSPLMLSVLATAYQEIQKSEFKSLDTVQSQRSRLFDIYINKMLTRQRKDRHYTLDETTNWLAWLAKNLSLHNQSVYQLEQMQPSWIPMSLSRMSYFLISRLPGVLLLILGIGLITTLPFLAAFSGIVLLGILVGVAILQKADHDIHVNQVYSWRWKRGARGAFIGILLGVLLQILSFFLSNRTICFNLLSIVVALLPPESVKYCFSIGVAWSPLYTFILGAIGAIIGGLSSRILESNSGANQGIRLTLRNAINNGLLIGLIASLIFGVDVVLDVTAIKDLPTLQITTGNLLNNMLIGGIYTGLVAFLWHGGQNAIRHYTLRAILVLTKATPAHFIHFLDHCVDLIFLRRVGGGYIFVHRLLMEHFVDMYTANEK
jgi:hypothetical protein